MRTTLLLLSTLLIASGASAQSVNAPIRLAGEKAGVDGLLERQAADVMGLEGPSQTPLLVIDDPPVSGAGGRLRGVVESFEVESEAWLELWSFYPDGTRAVARTLDREGPELRLGGTTERRPFQLPVSLGADGAKPLRIELSVGMLGSGVISVSKLRLVNDAEKSAAATPGSAGTSDVVSAFPLLPVSAPGRPLVSCLSSSPAFDRVSGPLAALRSLAVATAMPPVARLASGPETRSRCTPSQKERRDGSTANF